MAKQARQRNVHPTVQDREHLLIEQVAAKDRAAFEELYYLYHRRLVSFLLRFTRRPDLLDEILNDIRFLIKKEQTSFVLNIIADLHPELKPLRDTPSVLLNTKPMRRQLQVRWPVSPWAGQLVSPFDGNRRVALWRLLDLVQRLGCAQEAGRVGIAHHLNFQMPIRDLRFGWLYFTLRRAWKIIRIDCGGRCPPYNFEP